MKRHIGAPLRPSPPSSSRMPAASSSSNTLAINGHFPDAQFYFASTGRSASSPNSVSSSRDNLFDHAFPIYQPPSEDGVKRSLFQLEMQRLHSPSIPPLSFNLPSILHSMNDSSQSIPPSAPQPSPLSGNHSARNHKTNNKSEIAGRGKRPNTARSRIVKGKNRPNQPPPSSNPHPQPPSMNQSHQKDPLYHPIVDVASVSEKYPPPVPFPVRSMPNYRPSTSPSPSPPPSTHSRSSSSSAAFHMIPNAYRPQRIQNERLLPLTYSHPVGASIISPSNHLTDFVDSIEISGTKAKVALMPKVFLTNTQKTIKPPVVKGAKREMKEIKSIIDTGRGSEAAHARMKKELVQLQKIRTNKILTNADILPILFRPKSLPNIPPTPLPVSAASNKQPSHTQTNESIQDTKKTYLQDAVQTSSFCSPVSRSSPSSSSVLPLGHVRQIAPRIRRSNSFSHSRPPPHPPSKQLSALIAVAQKSGLPKPVAEKFAKLLLEKIMNDGGGISAFTNRMSGMEIFDTTSVSTNNPPLSSLFSVGFDLQATLDELRRFVRKAKKIKVNIDEKENIEGGTAPMNGSDIKKGPVNWETLLESIDAEMNDLLERRLAERRQRRHDELNNKKLATLVIPPPKPKKKRRTKKQKNSEGGEENREEESETESETFSERSLPQSSRVEASIASLPVFPFPPTQFLFANKEKEKEFEHQELSTEVAEEKKEKEGGNGESESWENYKAVLYDVEQERFERQFKIASIAPNSEQPSLLTLPINTSMILSLSPRLSVHRSNHNSNSSTPAPLSSRSSPSVSKPPSPRRNTINKTSDDKSSITQTNSDRRSQDLGPWSSRSNGDGGLDDTKQKQSAIRSSKKDEAEELVEFLLSNHKESSFD